MATTQERVEEQTGLQTPETGEKHRSLRQDVWRQFKKHKGAVVGLTRSLTTAGAAHGIKVNLIAPAATTRMSPDASAAPQLHPEDVAPMVAFLAHEDCPVTGEMYAAGAGRFARIFIASTVGYVHPGPAPTVEDVARNWETINDEQGYYVPADLMSWSEAFLAHLGP